MHDDDINRINEEKKQLESMRNAQNNAIAVRVGGKIAESSGEPHLVVTGKIINTADKVTGGKSSEILGKGMAREFNKSFKGRQTQRAINRISGTNLNDFSNSSYKINDDDIDKTIDAEVRFPIKFKTFLIILIILIPILFLMFFLVLSDKNSSTGSSLSFNGFYTSKCDDVTVVFVDPLNNYEVTGTETYNMTDYVAGVVAAEVGGLANKEVYKTFAVAARTYAELNFDDQCTIESSERFQVFKDITKSTTNDSELIYDAVKETDGQVITENGNLYLTEYDAFCYISKDSNNYTLSQQNQQIPVSWVNSNVGNSIYRNCPCEANDSSMTECWVNGQWSDGGHGRGMSQYGALYLASEEDYTYEEILSYYYGDDIVIASNSFITSIAGLEIKDTTSASSLNEPITSFLNSNGSSLDDLNNFVHDSVSSIGAGTREGVVTAAVSMINYLYDNFNTKLPYYWDGKTSGNTIPSIFGTYQPSAMSRNGNTYYYISFDCSGFVSWAIRAGGYNLTNQTSYSFDALYSDDSCVITDSSCVGQPGDLINSPNGHVELIVAVDIDNGKYFIAHSGTAGVVMTQRDMHTGNSTTSTTKVIFMDNYYNNSSNVNDSY